MTTPDLTTRNVEVLRLIADGLTDAQIGAELHLAEGTVAAHVVSLYRRLEAKNRAHAVAIGYRRGILPLGETS